MYSILENKVLLPLINNTFAFWLHPLPDYPGYNSIVTVRVKCPMPVHLEPLLFDWYGDCECRWARCVYSGNSGSLSKICSLIMRLWAQGKSSENHKVITGVHQSSGLTLINHVPLLMLSLDSFHFEGWHRYETGQEKKNSLIHFVFYQERWK